MLLPWEFVSLDKFLVAFVYCSIVSEVLGFTVGPPCDTQKRSEFGSVRILAGAFQRKMEVM